MALVMTRAEKKMHRASRNVLHRQNGGPQNSTDGLYAAIYFNSAQPEC